MDATSHDVLDEAALLWRITTYMTIELRRAHPGWSFYRYEDLVDDPARRFSEMFGRFNLPFSHGDPGQRREGHGSERLRLEGAAVCTRGRSAALAGR